LRPGSGASTLRVLNEEEVGAVLGRAVVAQGNPAKIEEVIAYVKDRVVPLVDAQAGSRGLSMFVNRDNGTIVVNSAWDDEASLKASDAALAPSRQEAIALLEAPEVEVHVLEPALIAQKEPDRPGFWSRAAEVQHATDAMDRAIAAFRDEVLPTLRERIDGVNTVALLVNRQTGHSVANVTFTSREAMEASRDATARMREDVLRRAGAELLSVRELEVVIVGIRPPVDLPAQGQPVEFPSSMSS
jgi:quinol monooxygenase YgiN